MDITSQDPQIDTLLEAQRRYFSSGKTRSISARRASLDRLERVLIDRQDDLLSALDQDLGKPGVEAYLAEYYFLLQFRQLGATSALACPLLLILINRSSAV